MRVLRMLIAACVARVGFDAAALATLANPASQNCAKKGGRLTIEKNPKGGEYGVCVFADKLQCEEWAMLRGQCRTGGIKVTGYATPAARYCTITGGTYRVVGASNTPEERGTCTFRGGNSCDALAYYEGSCARQAAAGKTIKAHLACAGGKSIDATFVNGPTSSGALLTKVRAFVDFLRGVLRRDGMTRRHSLTSTRWCKFHHSFKA